MTFFEFEYDTEKDEANWKKHGIRFSTAAMIFSDPMRIERLDGRPGNEGEERWQTVEKVGKVLFVVYTERGAKARLISARCATRSERRSYYGHDDNNDKGWSKAN